TGLLLPKPVSVPGLFGTDVDNNGTWLAADAVYKYYKIIIGSDTNFPGPNSIVVSNDFPIAGQTGNGPWLTNGPISKWIGPQADQIGRASCRERGKGAKAAGA